MKKMKRRIAGIVLIMMLITIVISPASFSAWADKTDETVDSTEAEVADNDETGDVIADEKDDIDATENESENADDSSVIAETNPYNVGDIIRFGTYEQDGDEENGKEEIEWQVLRVEPDRVLVVSRYALDCRSYNSEYTDVTWENCSLRTWLNNDFKNVAFSPEEQEMIPAVSVANDNNSYYGTEGGNDTSDQIFCLSVNEVNDFIGYSNYDDKDQNGYSQNLIAEPTQYAIYRGAPAYTITETDFDSSLKDKGYSDEVIGQCATWWWLRSPGGCGKDACNVSADGNAGAFINMIVDRSEFAVRPALFISILPALWKDSVELEEPIAMPNEEVEDNPIPESETIEEGSEEVMEEEDGPEETSEEETDIKPDEEEDKKDKDADVNPSEEDKEDKDTDINPSEDEDGKDEGADVNPGKENDGKTEDIDSHD